MLITIANIARLRTRREIPSPDCHVAIIGPNFGWLVSQLLKRSDDLEKHQLASRMNGVVGNKGKKMPRTPRNTDNQPSVM